MSIETGMKDHLYRKGKVSCDKMACDYWIENSYLHAIFRCGDIVRHIIHIIRVLIRLDYNVAKFLMLSSFRLAIVNSII